VRSRGAHCIEESKSLMSSKLSLASALFKTRGAISLAPWLQPGDGRPGFDIETVSTVFAPVENEKPLETVQEMISGVLNHRAEATVLMRSLRGTPHS